MKERELQHLGRRDLLELMIALSKDNDRLRARVDELEAQLRDRNLAIADSGSLAEAALKLSGVFQAAQEACDLYTQNVQERIRKMEAEAVERCSKPRNNRKKR